MSYRSIISSIYQIYRRRTLTIPNSSIMPASSLLQTWCLASLTIGTHGLQAMFPSAVDSCSCLNFKTTYAERGIKPGMGAEYGPPADKQNLLTCNFEKNICKEKPWQIVKPKKPMSAFYAACLQQFKVIANGGYSSQNHNMCMNIDRGNPRDTRMWCYVDSSCSQLNGGMKVSNTTSWKVCKAGQDSMLSDETPAQLRSLVVKNGMDMQFTATSAYPWHGPEGFEHGEYKDNTYTEKTTIGNCAKKDCYKLHYHNESWQVWGDSIKNFKCVRNCPATKKAALLVHDGTVSSV